jgi:mitochondrial fission protein ELM1
MRKLKALLLTEGMHGMISQVEGMAKALNVEFSHKIVRLSFPWNMLPPKLTPISSIILKDKSYLSNNENIDLIISCGRKSVVPSILFKKKNKKIFTIHIQNPKVNFKNFDAIIAPEHDKLKGENIYSSKGAIHYITLSEIKDAQNYLKSKVSDKKIVSLILGGPNKYYSFNNEELLKIFNEIKLKFISKGYQVIVIRSMRTSDTSIEFALKELGEYGHVVTSVDKQAYLSALALANNIIVTCDSTSMISESATSGKPIYVAHMKTKKNNYRFKRFFKLFKDLGITRDLGEAVESWTYNQINETERIANIINSKLRS